MKKQSLMASTLQGEWIVARLHLSNKKILFNQYVHLNEQGEIINFRDATEELAKTKWLRGDVYI